MNPWKSSLETILEASSPSKPIAVTVVVITMSICCQVSHHGAVMCPFFVYETEILYKQRALAIFRYRSSYCFRLS